MSAVLTLNRPTAAATTSDGELREALAWESGQRPPEDKNTWAWLWEAIQGDFNDNRSTGQIAFDAAVSMIPVVDQICDVRDIIANCRAIAQSDEKADNRWKWVALVLTLIGLFPSVGSVVKGVLKIFFVFVRRYGMDRVVKAVDDGMTWVVTFLRKKEVQAHLRRLKVDEVFKWLADQVRSVRARVSAGSVLAAFDQGTGVLRGLLEKVTWMPGIGAQARQTIDMVQSVRRQADAKIGIALAPVQQVLDTILRRLEIEHLVHRAGILNTQNVHFRGTLPEAQAVSLMRRAEPLPAWLSPGRNRKFAPVDASRPEIRRMKAAAESKGWPSLTDKNIASFHRLRPDEVIGPAKLYRVISPSSGAMGDCWVSEEVFHALNKSADPKTAWRKHLAVWPDWNANGQFVVYDVPAAQKLKVWRGPASSQVKEDAPDLQAHLEGGWEQVIFKPTADNGAQWDAMRIYQRTGNSGQLKKVAMSGDEYRRLPASRQHAYVAVRERINDPRIKGPFDTKWGMTDFDVQLQDAKIGLPALPGQLTNVR